MTAGMTWQEWADHVADLTIAKVAGWVSGFTALFIAFIVAVKKVWPWMKAFVRMVDTIATLPERLDKIEERQEATAKELTDNHGSSLKDAVKRTEKIATSTQEKLEVHIEFCKQRELLLAGKKPE